jgi:hypothetical protein
MRIGLDFDNTIVSYDQLFHKVALEKSLISLEVPINKVAVRDHLRNTNQEDAWTEMQGYVYGARMNEAIAYPGLIAALHAIRDAGHELFIVSHKTQYPYAGERYDLHEASRSWITYNLQTSGSTLIHKSNIFFNPSKDEKIEKISQLKCDIFLDDLPEILLATHFPQDTKKCLFDPEGHYASLENEILVNLQSWKAFSDWVHNLGRNNESR